MQKKKFDKILSMPKINKQNLNAASFEAIEAAVQSFDRKNRRNNELADIINPVIKKAQEKRYIESEEYKLEQAIQKVVEDHERRMLSKPIDKSLRTN